MECPFQRIVNVLAVASFAVSGAVVASGLYVYVNRTSIIDGVKSQVMESVLGGMGGCLGGGAVVPEVGGSDLPLGSNDLATPTQPQAAAPAVPSGGLGVSQF